MKWVARALVALFVLMLLAGGALVAGYFWFKQQIEEPGPMAGGADQIVMIESGAGVISIGQQLEQDGLITDARLFRLSARLQNKEAGIKAGEYLIPADASMTEILDILNDGKVILHPVQVIEGSTVDQAMKAIADADFLTGPMPETPPEGAFLPNTYHFARGTSRTEVAQRLMTAQDDLMAEIWPDRQPDLPVNSIEEAVILASIVEKETGGIKDDDLVAGVFINRLNRGMKLQSDPTIIYGISKGERLTKIVDGKEVQRGIYLSEKNRETPYNTYFIDGLPPTPICNPSEAALRAVLQPVKTDYLFFVADGKGGHAFARTNSEHNRNVAAWRKIERERRAANGGSR